VGEFSAVRKAGAKEIKLLRVQTQTNKKKYEGGWEMPAWQFRVDIHRRMEEKGERARRGRCYEENVPDLNKIAL
jgi:hypothetical protein